MAISPGTTTGTTTTTTTANTAGLVVPDDQRTMLRNRVSWGAIIAGVVTALVTQLLLNLLGVGLGLSALDVDQAANNPSASGFSITAGIWFVVTGIVASLVGGIVAGRLSGTSDDNTARWHGLVSWAATTLVLAYLVTTALGGLVGGALNALGSTVGGAGRAAASAVSGVAQNTDGNALEAQVRRLVNPNDAQGVQDSVIAYIRASAAGDQAAATAARDRAVDALARTANISPDEARTRIGQAEQQYRQTVQQARDTATRAAETARKGAATAGLMGFAAFALGALAAWFGGGMGAPRRSMAVVGETTRRV